jgi:copper homeostasis protein
MNLEICVDNHESLVTAVENGADRIELCASLKEGGLTPPYSFIQAALRGPVPVFVMIRPRSCDFLYTGDEIDMMHEDIYVARNLGAPGVVLGVLNAHGEIDAVAMRSLIQQASGMDVTCHRAFDQVSDVNAAIETLVELGVKRILTSGQAADPYDGITTLGEIVRLARRRIMIMAAGVTPADVREVIERTGVDEVHSAAATRRRSYMAYVRSDARMGDGEDFSLNVVDGEVVRQLKASIKGG